MNSTIDAIKSSMVLSKILDAVDAGVKTEEIRKDPLKYIISGKTKEIIVNTGGEGIKVSKHILEEMTKRGDKLAMKLLQNNKFKYIEDKKKDENAFLYLENGYKNYDRENKVLIEIIKEGKIENKIGQD